MKKNINIAEILPETLISELRPKQISFLHEYLTNGQNATQAAKALAPTHKHPRNAGNRLLKQKEVQAALNHYKTLGLEQTFESHLEWVKRNRMLADEARKHKQMTACATFEKNIGEALGLINKRNKDDHEAQNTFNITINTTRPAEDVLKDVTGSSSRVLSSRKDD